MSGLIFILLVLTLVIAILNLLSRNLTRTQLKDFNLTTDEKISVQYTFSSRGFATVVAAYPIKANMYVKDNFFLITPKRNTLLNWLNFGHLPIVFTKEVDSVKKLTKLNNIIKPELISVSGTNNIRLEFKRNMIGNLKYYVRIKVLDKEKHDELMKIKNWS